MTFEEYARLAAGVQFAQWQLDLAERILQDQPFVMLRARRWGMIELWRVLEDYIGESG